MAFSTGTGGVLPHSSSGGHLHVAQGEATDLGAAKLTMLPTDPRERVLAVFPYLPAAYLTDKSVARISAMIDERHSANPQVKAGAEANLKELDELHGAIAAALNEEGYLFDGAAVRGRDILHALSEGAMVYAGGPLTPRRREGHLGFRASNGGRRNSRMSSQDMTGSVPATTAQTSDKSTLTTPSQQMATMGAGQPAQHM